MDDVFGAVVAPAADAVSRLVELTGGFGRRHVVLTIYGQDCVLVDPGGPLEHIPLPGMMEPIQRWTDEDGSIGDALIDSMRREQLRAGGARAWEPGN